MAPGAAASKLVVMLSKMLGAGKLVSGLLAKLLLSGAVVAAGRGLDSTSKLVQDALSCSICCTIADSWEAAAAFPCLWTMQAGIGKLPLFLC